MNSDFDRFPREYVDDLNREFYEGDPAAHLRTRLVLLVAVAEKGEALSKAFAAGFSHASVNVQPSELDEEFDHFVTLELVALAHAACETLLRQYLAHAHASGCPWLEISAYKDPGALRRAAQEILIADEQELLRSARFALRGDGGPSSGVPREAWEDDGRSITHLLRRAAKRFLDDAPIHNAIKHGLAVVARNSSLTMGDPGNPGSKALDLQGATIKFLHRSRTEIHDTMTFVPVDSTMRFVKVVVDQLSAIYSVGRARYLGSSPEPVVLLSRAELDTTIGLPTGTHLTGLHGLSFTRTLRVE